MHLCNGSIDFNYNFPKMNRLVLLLFLILAHPFSSTNAQSLSTTKLELLIGQIKGFNQGELVFEHSNFAHIQSLPYHFPFDANHAIDSLIFHLGVDSLQHEKGIIENGLTPTNGMYWAWQSGYIFVKWEGVIKNENEFSPFTFHLGGFQYPFRCDQRCAFGIHVPTKINELELSFEPTDELIQFIRKSDLEIMSPQRAAVQLIQLFGSCLHVQ